MSEEITISAKSLVKNFKTRRGASTAIDHIDLEVARGETYGLIGPDGAGKTTTTRVILGLLKRTGGESSILGFDSMKDTFKIRERVGYIAQRFVLPMDMTVKENLHFFAQVHSVGLGEQRRRIPELLEFAGLSRFTGRLAGQLSGGMKKKLALACSLVHEPEVVMFDEPTLGVDPVSRREFWDLLGNLRAEKGLTIFVCTPYMDEAERCNRVGLIYRGKMVAQDKPQAIRKQIPGKLLEFTPSDFRRALPIVEVMDGVLEVQTYGMMLHAFVDDIAGRQAQIESALASQDIACQGMREIEPRLEEAFISLIRKQQAANEGER